MAEKKKSEKKKKEEDKPSVSAPKSVTPAQMREQILREKLEEEKAKKAEEIFNRDTYRKEFRKYFSKIKREKGLNRNLEEVLWLHLKAVGKAKPELFDEGIKNFGL